MTATTILDVTLQLRDDLADRLIAEAIRRERNPVEVLADIIEVVIKENLFVAVLDT